MGNLFYSTQYSRVQCKFYMISTTVLSTSMILYSKRYISMTIGFELCRKKNDFFSRFLVWANIWAALLCIKTKKYKYW